MYDFVRIEVPSTRNVKYDKMGKIYPFFDSEGKPITYSKLENLVIKEKLSGITIQGSLPYYYFGNNIQTLNRFETKLAIQKLQEDLGISLENANVYRIDFATNFVMNHPYKNYFDFLFSCPYTIRGNIDDTLYFKNKQREICFYGKIKQAIDNKIPIPHNLEKYKETMLRYELRFTRNLKEQLGMNVKLKDLHEQSFYYKLVKKWNDNYFSIIKQQRIILDIGAYKTPKTLLNHFALSYINEKGIENIYYNLSANKSRFKSPVKYCRAKNSINKLMNDNSLSEPNELIEELDRKITATFQSQL